MCHLYLVRSAKIPMARVLSFTYLYLPSTVLLALTYDQNDALDRGARTL